MIIVNGPSPAIFFCLRQIGQKQFEFRTTEMRIGKGTQNVIDIQRNVRHFNRKCCPYRFSNYGVDVGDDNVSIIRVLCAPPFQRISPEADGLY